LPAVPARRRDALAFGDRPDPRDILERVDQGGRPSHLQIGSRDHHHRGAGSSIDVGRRAENGDRFGTNEFGDDGRFNLRVDLRYTHRT
jgi:hypothetical protein